MRTYIVRGWRGNETSPCVEKQAHPTGLDEYKAMLNAIEDAHPECGFWESQSAENGSIVGWQAFRKHNKEEA